MQIPLQYTYLMGSLVSLIPWLLIFLYRKDLQKPMLLMSVFMGIYGVFFEYFYWTLDWWAPVTLTGTRVGVEDFITAFSVGGIIAAIFPLLFSKRVSTETKPWLLKETVYLLILHVAIMSFIFGVINLHSAIATIVSYLVTTVIILCRRPDLITSSLVTGFAILLGSIPIFLLLFTLTPVFVQSTWMLSNITGVLFLGIPIEDLTFFLLLGLMFGPLYLYFTNKHFV